MKARDFKIHASLFITLLGVLLIIINIGTESEPGAIPLLITTIGSIWFFFHQRSLKSKQNTD